MPRDDRRDAGPNGGRCENAPKDGFRAYAVPPTGAVSLASAMPGKAEEFNGVRKRTCLVKARLGKGQPENLDPDAARAIAEECYGEVLAYCRRHAPAGCDGADLAQETFLRFVRARSYRERGKPIAYLMRVARNVCIDAARAQRIETVALDFDVADTRDAGVADAGAGVGFADSAGIAALGTAHAPAKGKAGVVHGSPPVSSAHSGVGAEAFDGMLGHALAKLPATEREAVELRFGAGLDVGEVALVMGISRFAARRRIQAALRTLRSTMEEGDAV